MVTTVDDPDLGPLRMQNVLCRRSETPGRIRITGRALGADTDRVLSDHDRGVLVLGGVEDRGCAAHVGRDDAARKGILAQRLQRRPMKFRQFVEEQNAEVGQRHFARPGPPAAAISSARLAVSWPLMSARSG